MYFVQCPVSGLPGLGRELCEIRWESWKVRLRGAYGIGSKEGEE